MCQLDILKKKQKVKETEPDEDEEKEEIKLCKVASWNRPGCEASTKFLDIAELGREASQDPEKAITFGGTNYGLRNQKLDDGQAPVSVPEEMPKILRAMKIKAGYLEKKAFSRKFRKKRETRKNVWYRWSQDLTTLFYHSNRVHHEKRAQKLFTGRVYDQVAAQKRRSVKTAATTDKVGTRKVMPIMAIGTQGTGSGSRLKGHIKCGGAWLHRRHCRYVSVSMTNEHRSSQLCVYCFERVERAKARRKKNGKWKVVKVNGASQWVNPNCVAYRSGRATQNRGVEAALASASNLLSAD
ncbi:hypothetical protein DFQ30_003455 [Apophysomyces sp. BC1015]|nr:hypothetical protein DFQ30_003455 [Apophysomyces sp. BC1015]